MALDQALALDRFGLGARPNDRVGTDPRGWVADQIARFDPRPPSLASQPGRAALLQQYQGFVEARKAARLQAKAAAATDPADPGKDALAMQRKGLRDVYLDAVGARFDTALASDAPFGDRLTHFWANHFAISSEKPEVGILAGNYEFEAIRPHVMGSFSDLLHAAVFHPAMMLFLDQAQSIGPNSPAAQRAARFGKGPKAKRGLNENLGREIMELHTLGVRTGYTQADVTEFARALTGWTVAGLGNRRVDRLSDGAPGEAVFVPQLHEPGPRQILGKTYADTGGGQAQAVLAMLAVHPATARHVATHVCRHFIADNPPEAAVARLERAFLDSRGDLPTVYHALIASPEAWVDSPGKFRNPWDWMVAAGRASGVQDFRGRRGIAGLLQQLGQPVWRPGSPAGWGDTTADWASPGALMSRIEVAQQIAGRLGDSVDPRQLAPIVLPGALSPQTAQAIARSEQPATGLALLLVSPEFLRR